MIDPRDLDATALTPFDRALLPANLDEFDDGDPLGLELTAVRGADSDALRSVAVAADHCIFTGCDLSLMHFHGVKNSLFIGCKLRGTRFDRFVRNVVFDACQLTECLFRMMKCDGVAFDNGHLSGCDFYGSELKRLSFAGSGFHGVGFDRCSIEAVDLTEATDLMVGDPRTLAGAAICETQLPLIAARLAELSGIEVQDC